MATSHADTATAGDGAKSNVIVGDTVTVPTAGATGRERVGKKRSRRHGHGGHHGSSKKKRRSDGGGGGGSTDRVKINSNVVAVPAAPPLFDTHPMTNEENMAGYADRVARSIIGAENCQTLTALPSNQNRLTHESFIHFRVQSSSDQHIRFRPDSLTIVFYATRLNPTPDAQAAKTTEKGAERHALLARSSKPFMYLDPSVMGTSFFSHVETLVDNVPVGSNGLLGNLLIQYVRVSEIFNANPRPHFSTSDDLKTDLLGKAGGEALDLGTSAFDYGTWDSKTGVRIECRLRGQFPFDFKNEAAASSDNLKEPNYYFPPGTTFDFRFHYHPDKFAAVFHSKISENMSEYFTARGTAAEGFGVSDYSAEDIRFQIAEANLEYDVIELRAAQQLDYLDKMKTHAAIYRYDVVRGQHVSLPAGQTYVDIAFTIPPWARMVYVMFLRDWATFYMPAYRRPISGFSMFPENCSKMELVLSNRNRLITPHLDRLGFNGEQVQQGKRVVYNYYKNHRTYAGTFDQLFPRSSATIPFNQILLSDLRDQMSDKAELLNVRASFATGKSSPQNTQIAVISVHSTGEVTCRHGGGASHYDWRWEVKY